MLEVRQTAVALQLRVECRRQSFDERGDGCPDLELFRGQGGGVRLLWLPPEVMKASIIGQNRTTLLERFIEPDEIASLVTYIASPRSSATNGAALRAEGGVLPAML